MFTLNASNSDMLFKGLDVGVCRRQTPT